MPPRRSNRSSTRTLDPPVNNQTSTKRKRNQSDADEYSANEKENVTKSSSTSHKPTSVRSAVVPPSTRSRASVRSHSSLKQVPETDEDSPPPVKKKRPSTEPETEQNDGESSDEDIEELEQVTTRRAPATRNSSITSASKNGTDGTQKDRVSKANTRSSVSRKGSVPPNRRSARASSKLVVEDHASIAISDDDEEPVLKSRPPSRKTPKYTEEEAHSDHKTPTPQARNIAVKSRIPTRNLGAKSRMTIESSEDEGMKVSISSSKLDPPTEQVSKLEPNASIADGKSDVHDQDADEELIEDIVKAKSVSHMKEEQSLLDPPSVVPPHSQSAIPHLEEPKGPQARLVIHKMALINFKSYAGRQEIGPFHKSFSAIVGPNGSGKSNTIDALLFVFGYRAAKMRQGKLSELIHNSARYPNLQECSVEIHFREIIDLPGPDAFEIVPGSQLIITRTAYKNNNSKYTIGGHISTYKEVQTLLKSRDIDLDHNRFLILQGEVEAIALMKPKAPSEHEDGLLEYLEDIIGTSRFKEPLEEAFTEMEHLSEERVDKLNRLRITEKEKNALEDKKREAEDYLRLHNEHVRALSRLWQWYLWKCLENEEEFEKHINQLQKDLAEERDGNKDDITHHEMLQAHYLEREKAYADIKDAADEASKDLAKHEKQQIGLEERKKHASGKTKKLKKSIQDDERAYNEALRSLDTNSSKIEKEKSKVEEHEANLAKEEKVLEGIRDSLKDKTQVFHDQIEVKQKDLQPWTSKINAKQAEIDIATSERDALIKKAETIKEAREEAEVNLGNLQEDHRMKVTELGELKTRKAEVLNESKTCQQSLQDAKDRVQDLRQKSSSMRQKVDEAKASQATNKSQNQVLDSLTRLQSSGRINGFYGRLGNLGTIPDKYDVAVTTAASALNHLLVDTVDQGQACIEYLRKQNIGRASFMVLEKLPQRNFDKISTPEDVPRLFDLIKPKEPRFAAAFYKAVGNTLVADDMNQANRIAYGQKRWRVVTLAGQLIDSSGTMSGGGNHVSRGGMSSKFAADAVTPAVLKQYEQENDNVAVKLNDALKELHSVESQIDNLARSSPQIDLSIQKTNLDIENSAKRIAEAEKRVREFRSKAKPDAADSSRISILERDIASATEELNNLQGKASTIQDDIKTLEKKILEIGGARLLAQKSKVDGIKLHINVANDEITKAEVAKGKAEKDSAKFAKSIENNKESLTDAENDLEELTGQVKECARYVEEIRSKVEDARVAQDNSKDDLEKLKKELDEKTEQIRGFKKREMELLQQLQLLKKDAAENVKTLEHWRNEHDKLKLEEIDDDEDDEDDSKAGNEAEVKVEPGREISQKSKNHSETPPSELHIYTVEELQRFKQRDMVADTELLDEKLKNAKPNLSVLKEYRKREEEFFKRAQELENVTKLRDEQKQKYDNLRKQRLDDFMTGFNTISFKLKEMYQTITLGGNAELELVDSMDPFSEGIIFSVMPPKKSWRNISNLSGGEKTLSSLALVFALHAYKPTPLYFMDEIDAALDFRNVSIVANYIKDRTKNAQFIIISLRNDMFELSHRLIGIYKTANATRSVSIDNFALNVEPVPS